VKNPLIGIPKEELLSDVEEFCKMAALSDHLPMFRKGALLAQNPRGFENQPDLTNEERDHLRVEKTNRWKHPRTL
jgi:hypothetical protein